MQVRVKLHSSQKRFLNSDAARLARGDSDQDLREGVLQDWCLSGGLSSVEMIGGTRGWISCFG